MLEIRPRIVLVHKLGANFLGPKARLATYPTVRSFVQIYLQMSFRYDIIFELWMLENPRFGEDDRIGCAYSTVVTCWKRNVAAAATTTRRAAEKSSHFMVYCFPEFYCSDSSVRAFMLYNIYSCHFRFCS